MVRTTSDDTGRPGLCGTLANCSIGVSKVIGVLAVGANVTPPSTEYEIGLISFIDNSEEVITSYVE